MQALHDYAYIHAFVAHAADGAIQPQELDRIRLNVARVARSLGHQRGETESLVTDTVRGYLAQLHDDGAAFVLDRFREAVRRLYDTFRHQEDVLDQIMQDLLAVIHADGVIADMEVYLLDQVADAWSHTAAP